MTNANTPVALTIGGSDCSAGAGIQADLKTFSSFGVYGLSALSCVVAETPRVVKAVYPVDPLALQTQLSLLLESYPVVAIKTGMLYSKAHIYAVCEILEQTEVPLVVDPVMVASTGDPLLTEDAVHAIRHRLCPLATILTPNLPEAGVLLNREVVTPEDQREAAEALAERYQNYCYLKGGHLENVPEHRDLLVGKGESENLVAPHLDLKYTHGTGCTLSAALAAGLALGYPIVKTAGMAKKFVHRALEESLHWTDISHLQQTQKVDI